MIDPQISENTKNKHFLELLLEKSHAEVDSFRFECAAEVGGKRGNATFALFPSPFGNRVVTFLVVLLLIPFCLAFLQQSEDPLARMT